MNKTQIIIQINLYSDEDFKKISGAAIRLMEFYDVYFCKIIFFSNELAPEPKIDLSRPVLVFGSTTMCNIAKSRIYTPGVFLNENFNSEIYNNKYKEEMLNYGAVSTTFKEANNNLSDEEVIFLRPILDDKSFTGLLICGKELRFWQDRVSKGYGYSLSLDTKVLVGQPKEIYREYRLFVVDNQIITSSLYKLNDKLCISSIVDDDVLEYGQKIIDIWQPDRAFALDIARTPDGLKVIEINCINAAGVYACNVQKIIISLAELSERVYYE